MAEDVARFQRERGVAARGGFAHHHHRRILVGFESGEGINHKSNFHKNDAPYSAAMAEGAICFCVANTDFLSIISPSITSSFAAASIASRATTP